MDFGFSDSSESEPEPDPESEESFLAAFFGAGLSESDEDPEDESFLAAFLAGAFLAGLSLSEEESEEESFLAAFLAGAAFFGAGLSESESLSEEEESATLDFLTGTTAFSEVFLDLFLEALETLESALALLAMTLDGFFSALEEEEEESLELDACFLDFFSTVFLVLFLESSIDCFLDDQVSFQRPDRFRWQSVSFDLLPH